MGLLLASRRRILVAALAVLAAGAGTGIGAAASTSNATPVKTAAGPRLADRVPARVPTEAASNLYAIEAKAGWARKVADRRWVLSLQHPRVIWFADRPMRAGGPTTAKRLAAAWPRLFYGSAPNGVIVAPGAPAGERPTALIISNPRLGSDVISFDITVDKGTTDAAARWLSSLTRARSGDNGGVALFIDDSDDTDVYTIFPLVTPVPDSMAVVWRPDLSQCAGYGTVKPDGDGFDLTFEVNNSGHCFAKPTYARFDVWSQGKRLGTVTIGNRGEGNGSFVSCSVASLACDPRDGNDMVYVDFWNGATPDG